MKECRKRVEGKGRRTAESIKRESEKERKGEREMAGR